MSAMSVFPRDFVQPAVLAGYRGAAHGDDPEGVWDIEFNSVISAAAWIGHLPEEYQMATSFRDPVLYPMLSVVVQFHTRKLPAVPVENYLR